MVYKGRKVNLTLSFQTMVYVVILARQKFAQTTILRLENGENQYRLAQNYFKRFKTKDTGHLMKFYYNCGYMSVYILTFCPLTSLTLFQVLPFSLY